MGYNVSQSFISGQPPLLIFTLCLTAFGLTMIVLAYVVGEQDVPNPDVQMDWNNFFRKMASFKLCPLHNDTKSSPDGSIKNSNKSLYYSSHVVDESESLSAVLSNVVHYSSDEKLDYSEISAKVHFKLIGKIHPSSFFQVTGKIKGSLLGFTGKYASLFFNVSLSFVAPLNNSCLGETCSSVWEACLIMKIPSDLLYETKNLERCDIKVVTSPDSLAVFYVSVGKSEDVSAASCLSLSYTSDSKLTEMLSLHDRSIVNLHLMHTSYFMFVMVMTLVCYSLIRGRCYTKSSHPFEKGRSNHWWRCSLKRVSKSLSIDMTNAFICMPIISKRYKVPQSA